MSHHVDQSIKGDSNTQSVINNYTNSVGNLSTILGTILPEISSVVSGTLECKDDVTPYGIEDKINHNEILYFRDIIEDYAQYGIRIDLLYDEQDNQSPGFKTKTLDYFKNKYRIKKANLCAKNPQNDPVALMKKHSDLIMGEIHQEFINDLKKTDNIGVTMEELEGCAIAVICHAFICCKILEKP